MAINQVNSYGAANTDIVNVQTTVDSQRLGYHQVSLTEWGTTTVPAIAAGSVFENNGALWEITTNTALTGSPSDGKVFIYFDSDTPQFVMTNTAPTWSASKQGWYGTGGTANYRYLLFAMTKSGSSYSDKRIVLHNNNEDRFTLENWTNNDSELFFASDASIQWDESENFFYSSKIVKSKMYRQPINTTGYDYSSAQTENTVYEAFSGFLEDGTVVLASGQFGSDSICWIQLDGSDLKIGYGNNNTIKTFTDNDGTAIGSNLCITF